MGFWKNGFPDAEFTVREFTRNSLKNGDVVADFAEAARIPLEGFDLPKNHNPSLGWKAQLFLMEFNKHIPGVANGAKATDRGNINKILENNFSGKGILPLRQDAENFLSQFSKDNEELRKTWFPDRSAIFDADFSSYPESANDLQLSTEDMFAIFAKVYEVSLNKNRRLRIELEKAKEQIDRLSANK